MLAGTLCCAAAAAGAPGAEAGVLNVPGDFPGSFSMNLLGGFMAVDNPGSGGSEVGGGLLNAPVVSSVAEPIRFDAGAFDGVGPGAGSSALTLTSVDHWHIASAQVFGSPVEFYIDGAGTGTLVDHAGSTSGDWTLAVPLHATWIGNDFVFPDFVLSTAASYTYYPRGLSYPSSSSLKTVSGQAMDYATGDAFLVGQSASGFDNGPFPGLRVTIGLYGNDPTTIPEPGTLWIMAPGLLALGWRTRRRDRFGLPGT